MEYEDRMLLYVIVIVALTALNFGILIGRLMC